MSAAGPHPEHGSLAEEALRLVEALSGRGPGPEPGPAASAGHAHPVDRELSGDCAWCPLCRAARAVRPEVREHLAAAGSALVAALAAALAPPPDMMGADPDARDTQESDPR